MSVGGGSQLGPAAAEAVPRSNLTHSQVVALKKAPCIRVTTINVRTASPPSQDITLAFMLVILILIRFLLQINKLWLMKISLQSLRKAIPRTAK